MCVPHATTAARSQLRCTGIVEGDGCPGSQGPDNKAPGSSGDGGNGDSGASKKEYYGSPKDHGALAAHHARAGLHVETNSSVTETFSHWFEEPGV